MRKIVAIAGLAIIVTASTVYAAGITEEQMTRPEGSAPHAAERADLVAKGEALWNDKSLSGKGKKACSSCHKGNTKMFKASFLEEYPHAVKMAKKRAKMESVDSEQMVQFCMLAAMKGDMLDWESEELAALAAYQVDVVQVEYRAAKAK